MVRLSDAAVLTPTVAALAGEVTAAFAGVWPDAVAALLTEPASRSAWVATYVPVQVVERPGSRLVTGQEIGPPGPAGAANVSATPSWATVTLPLLVTAKE